MKPIKSSEVEKHFKAPVSRPLLDLRDVNLVHAAPIENGRALLTMRFDPKINALVPEVHPLH